MPTADALRRRTQWKNLLGTALVLALWQPHDAGPDGSDGERLGVDAGHAVVEGKRPVSMPPARPEGVLWAGCSEVRLASLDGGSIDCTFSTDAPGESDALRVWLPSSVSEPVVYLNGEPIAATDAKQVDDGWSLQIRPGHDGRLTVAGKVDGDVRRELLAFDVDFRPRPDKKLREQLDAAVGNEAAQRALAEDLLDQLAREPSLPQRLLLTRYLQYVRFDLGEHRPSLQHALEAAELAGMLSEPLTESASLRAAGFILAEHLADKQAASTVLKRALVHQASIPYVAMRGTYYQGLLELSLGRFATARHSIESSTQIARRLRWPRWEIIALNPLVETLASQGRFAWARQTLERAHELGVTGREAGLLGVCEAQAHHHHKRGDLADREAQLTGVAPDGASEHWLAAREIYRDRARCPDHPSVHAGAAEVEVDLARAATAAGELDRAEAILDAIPSTTMTPSIEVRARLLRAELALERGHPRAARRILESFAADVKRGALADAVGPGDWWRLHLAQARMHQRRGDLTAALGALARAQERLDGDQPSASLGVETDRHAAMRRQSSQLLVRLLLERGLEEQALCAARIARARGLASAEAIPAHARASLLEVQRSRAALFEGYKWYDPRDIPLDERMKVEEGQRGATSMLASSPPPVQCDQLPAAQPGEAALLYFHDGRGWLGFAWGPSGRVVVRRLSHGPAGRLPDAAGETLIAPFADVLEGATRLRVLAPPVMHDVSFADLPWRGQPLGDALTVAYALDLPRVPSEPPREGTVALIFSDPHKLLAGSYEALMPRFHDWRSRLEANERHVAFFAPPSLAAGYASVAEIVERTRGVELALLYGFGAIQPSYYDLFEPHGAHHEPDQDGLGLGADVLTRADILLHAGTGPRHVVLAHCDSASVDIHGVSGAVGLAQSHVQAGAEWALGTAGNVDPKSMEVVVDVVLGAYSRGSRVEDVAKALQLAKRHLRDEGLPHGEQLRLWIP